jgi:glucokinase
MGYYLGVDLGGTNLRVAVATESLEILGCVKRPTPSNATSAEITDAILRAVDGACDDAGCEPSAVVAAGIGSVGPFDYDAGTIEDPSNIPGVERPIALVDPLRERLAVETVVLDNDAVCGVIAEAQFAEPTPESMVYLTVSTGIGAGVIVDGRVLSGRNVAEVGHMTLDPAGTMRCGCGRDGHWEAYAGGANVPAYARTLADAESIETALPIETGAVTTEELFDALGDDPLADRVVDELGRWNTLGVANVVQAFAPGEVTVGGAIALNNRDAVLGPIRRNLAEHVMVDVPTIRPAAAGEDAVLYGAIISARDRVADAP